MLGDDVLNALAANGQDVQPHQNRPETILLPNVVGAVPALSSQMVAMLASSRLPKNFQPVGVSYMPMPRFSATRSLGAGSAWNGRCRRWNSRAPD